MNNITRAVKAAQKNTSVIPTGCWEWGGFTHKGYARRTVRTTDGTTIIYIHREVYRGIYGFIEGEVHHMCENKSCINPSHLVDIETFKHLMITIHAPARINDKKTHCPRGHELAGYNLRIKSRKDGRVNRRCRTCDQKLDAQYRRRRSLDPKQPPVSSV